MKNKSTLMILFLLGFLLSANITFAQFNDYTIKLGIQPNVLLSDTEFDKDLRPANAKYEFSGLGRVFLRFEFFTEVLEAEVG